MREENVNYVATTNGKVRAVCEYCGKKSKTVIADKDGEPDIHNLSSGWWCAPYPVDFEHQDGSTGSKYHCRQCHKRMKSVEGVKSRQAA